MFVRENLFTGIKGKRGIARISCISYPIFDFDIYIIYDFAEKCARYNGTEKMCVRGSDIAC